MKAVVYGKYGPPDVPELREVAKPPSTNACPKMGWWRWNRPT